MVSAPGGYYTHLVTNFMPIPRGCETGVFARVSGTLLRPQNLEFTAALGAGRSGAIVGHRASGPPPRRLGWYGHLQSVAYELLCDDVPHPAVPRSVPVLEDVRAENPLRAELVRTVGLVRCPVVGLVVLEVATMSS